MSVLAGLALACGEAWEPGKKLFGAQLLPYTCGHLATVSDPLGAPGIQELIVFVCAVQNSRH